MTPDVQLLLVLASGLILGSFANVAIHRLPRMIELAWRNELRQFEREQQGLEPLPDSELEQLSLSRPRSHCPQCKTTLPPHHLVPVLSWLLLRGRCAHCQARIPVRYPVVELLSALLAWGSWHSLGWTPEAAAAFLFLETLLVATLIDWDSQWLPDLVTLPLMWAGILLASLGWSPVALSLDLAVWGAVGGYLFLWIMAALFKLFTGKDGLGGGDTKLLAALGAWLGPMVLPAILLLSSLLGLLMAFWLRWRRKQQGTFPFGPALSLAGVVYFAQALLAG